MRCVSKVICFALYCSMLDCINGFRSACQQSNLRFSKTWMNQKWLAKPIVAASLLSGCPENWRLLIWTMRGKMKKFVGLQLQWHLPKRNTPARIICIFLGKRKFKNCVYQPTPPLIAIPTTAKERSGSLLWTPWTVWTLFDPDLGFNMFFLSMWNGLGPL